MEKTKILVVEDEGIIAKDIERTLRDLGYSVPAIAASGEEAIQKALETQPDLILMDIVLRGKMDGVEAAERILARRKIPIIYLTAYSDEATFQRAKITEPYGYLLKPFQEKELQSTIEVALYKCQMEKKLKENEQWLSTTLRSINDGVITTKNDGLITFMNPLAEGLTGWKKAEAVGRPLEEVFHLIQEGNGQKYEIPVKKVVREGVIVGRRDSISLVEKNGRKRPIDYSLAPLGDGQENISGTVLAFRDITERKKAEENLQRERERLEIVTQNIGAGVAIISRDYQTIWANQVLKQTFGKVEGRLCHSTYNQREEICTDCGVKKIFEKQADKVVHEQKGKDKSGEQIWSEIIATPIKDKEGNITAAVELVVSITERKRTEEALRQSEKAAKQLVRENTTLAKIGQIISSTLNIEEIYSRFAEETQKLIPFDRISINILNDNKTTFSIQYVWGLPIPNRQPGDAYPAAGSLSGEVIKNRYGSILHIEEEKEIASRFPA
ncbi:MAG: PAS domain S-box protein, partial [Deltaproteobacteria bacterium]|nr:PAS domain S-box protein [Deltaproteobacteria bacterium]